LTFNIQDGTGQTSFNLTIEEVRTFLSEQGFDNGAVESLIIQLMRRKTLTVRDVKIFLA